MAKVPLVPAGPNPTRRSSGRSESAGGCRWPEEGGEKRERKKKTVFTTSGSKPGEIHILLLDSGKGDKSQTRFQALCTVEGGLHACMYCTIDDDEKRGARARHKSSP
jgi:hypothetical protein